jgi:glycosyltransferase involved in cell wall biosynthesis
MSNPIFSIITPTYNCAEFIFRSYNLLKNQTENSWEWIVVDDGSTDASSELFQSINDNRIVFCIL